jgi:hypothetical protein
MPKKEIDDFNFEFRRETDKAICVSEDGTKEFWLPKSQIEFEHKTDGSVDVTLPIWLAKEKGLAGY